MLEFSEMTAIIFAERDDEFTIIKNAFHHSATINRVPTFSIASISDIYNKSKPDILITATKLADREGLVLLESVVQRSGLPVLWFVESGSQQFATSAIRTGITTFVVGGLFSNRIESLVCVTLERHQLFVTLRWQIENQSEELKTRKIVERAKGMLMQSKSMSEEDAYKTMRSMAMN